MVVGVQVVDCSEGSNKDCRHAQHAANAFDTEKVALMHGIFQMLQAPMGKPLSWCIPPLSRFGMTCLDLSCILVCVLMKHVTFLTQGLFVVTAGLSVENDFGTCCTRSRRGVEWTVGTCGWYSFRWWDDSCDLNCRSGRPE